MGKTLCYKILEEHLISGKLEKGNEIVIKIDQTLTQDATGTMAYLQFESLSLDRVKTELSVSYVDHNTIQVGFENADDHEYLRTIAQNKGIVFSRAGNGICHQVHLERFALPGKTLIGSDSHTPTSSAVGSFAFGAGGLDCALSMAGVGFSMVAPRVVNIILKGKLRPFVSAKDIILKVLQHFGVKGNVNTVFEYTGDGVKTLSIPERATITNMGAECGVTTSLFPSDEVTYAFLVGQKREEGWRELSADIDAIYDDTYIIDLDELEPLISCPHSPGNVMRVKDLEGMKVDQVLIGSCTNSSYFDLAKSAKIVSSHTIPSHLSFGVAPGSRAVLEMITQSGILLDFVKSGARILESACGFCIGNHQSPQTNGISLRTNNRNFEGRSGTKSAQVYLVSPETAAYSAIMGELRDPRECECNIEDVKYSDNFIVDDSMFIFPGEKCEIKRGPNIGEPPHSPTPQETLSGSLLLKVGDKVTTDHIMPAGQYLKYRSNIKKYSEFVFLPLDPTFSTRALEEKNKGRANFIVASLSYGQGSSREHAAICPMYLGVRAVIAVSIERIHQANLCNFGILPLLFKNKEDYTKLDQGDELELSDILSCIDKGEFILKDKTKNIEIPLTLFATELQKDMLKKGGRLNQIKEKINER